MTRFLKGVKFLANLKTSSYSVCSPWKCPVCWLSTWMTKQEGCATDSVCRIVVKEKMRCLCVEVNLTGICICKTHAYVMCVDKSLTCNVTLSRRGSGTRTVGCHCCLATFLLPLLEKCPCLPYLPRGQPCRAAPVETGLD